MFKFSASMKKGKIKLTNFIRLKHQLIFSFYVLLGLFLVLSTFFLYKNYLINFFIQKGITSDFPWTLITALGAAPVTLFLWYWKNENEIRNIDDQRFHSSIENLGNTKINIRLAGIYTLENLVNSNPDRAPNVIEVLCIHLRCNTLKQGSTDDKETQLENKEIQLENKICLDIISRIWYKNHMHWDFTKNEKPDLRDINLKSYDFWGVHLEQFFMEKSHLDETKLLEANLNGACLDHATLLNADLTQSTMKKATFVEAILNKACLDFVDMEGANLTKAKMNETRLYGAKLNNVKGLTEEQLENALGCIETGLPNGYKRPEKWNKKYPGNYLENCKKICDKRDSCPVEVRAEWSTITN